MQNTDMTANRGETGEVRETAADQLPHKAQADELLVAGQRGRVPADTFSNRLLLARAMAGHLSIREACERTGLNRGNWQGWERGLRPRDQVEISRLIANELDVDFNWLLLGGPLEGPRGRVVTKRPGTDRVTYFAVPTRPKSDRPKVRGDSPRPISPQPGQPRRANWVQSGRPADVINAG